MKRKITNLEQQLINDGWYLAIKKYTGKHSQKVYCYEYHKTIDNYDHVIALDTKRENVVKYGINDVKIDFLGKEALAQAHLLYMKLRDYVNEHLLDNYIPMELLESEE